MKRLFEGATVVSAILLLLTTFCIFVFNVQRHTEKGKHRSHEDKKVEKAERKKDLHHERKFEKYVEEREKEHSKDKDKRAKDEEELEYLRKMNDPLWHYYDDDAHQFKVLSGEYDVDCPGNRP